MFPFLALYMTYFSLTAINALREYYQSQQSVFHLRLLRAISRYEKYFMPFVSATSFILL